MVRVPVVRLPVVHRRSSRADQAGKLTFRRIGLVPEWVEREAPVPPVGEILAKGAVGTGRGVALDAGIRLGLGHRGRHGRGG